jgi:hypothetical protein
MLRTTRDSDLVTEPTQNHIPLFIAHLEGGFLLDEMMVNDALSRHSSFYMTYNGCNFEVDVFTTPKRPFLKKQFERARRQMLSIEPLINARVASSEDTLLAKLECFRMGREVSELIWRNVLGALEVQSGSLDTSYVDQMSKGIGVEDLLLKALNEG